MSDDADRRSVNTDALATLGTIIGPGEARDAIHIAVEPVIAAHRLRRGQDVGLLPDGRASAYAKHIAIVDPFLTEEVPAGARFWLLVYPRQITSLRHVWAHPDFPDAEIGPPADAREVSRAWIQAYVADLNGEHYQDYYAEDYSCDPLTYDELMEHAETWCDTDSKWGGDYLVKAGMLEGVSVHPDFWRHFTAVTGKSPQESNPHFFSCSC